MGQLGMVAASAQAQCCQSQDVSPEDRRQAFQAETANRGLCGMPCECPGPCSLHHGDAGKIGVVWSSQVSRTQCRLLVLITENPAGY